MDSSLDQTLRGKKREIRQLWDATCELFELAKIEFNNLDPKDREITVKQLANRYRTGIPKKENTKRPNKLTAFLASAAVRLTTISEICKKNGIQILQDDYLKEHRQHRRACDKSAVENDLKNNIDRYIHVLLRDNIRHRERAEEKMIYGVRQDVVEQLKISKIYVLMQNIRKQFEDYLRNQRVI